MKFHHTQQGFTIIETLVAITILMLAIAGPLTIAHKGLLAAIYAHEQVTASYLAQDAMEFIKNVRDNNVRKGRINWLEGFSGCISTDTSNPSTYCIVDTIAGNPATPSGITGGITSCSGTACALYPRSEGYTHTSDSSTPKYSRYFYISSSAAALSTEAKAVVTVKWDSGTINNQTIYEAEIFNVAK